MVFLVGNFLFVSYVGNQVVLFLVFEEVLGKGFEYGGCVICFSVVGQQWYRYCILGGDIW